MLIVVVSLLIVLSVPLAGGRLSLLGDIELRQTWVIGAAIGVQVLVISVAPAQLGDLARPLHLGTYALAGAFLWANRHISGLWLIGLGGCSNFAAIAANGGVMPASSSALATAGLAPDKGESFANSAALAHPHLAFLGDVFAVPASLPLSNVFSAGDICIAVGLAVATHTVCRSRLVPAGNGDLVALLRERTFARVWLAQVISNLGDFAYSLAVAVTVIEHGDGAATLATVLIVQAAPAIVTSLVGGQLVDRLSRRRLMVAADVLRAVAVGSLLAVGTPSTAHILVVAGCLGTFGALFQPALQASLPNLVPRRLLLSANALVGATFHVAVLAGPLLGGFVAANAGADAAFALNAASFAGSAALLLTVTIPQLENVALGAGIAAIREGMRHALVTPLIRGIFVVTSIALFAASLKQPVEPVFVLGPLGGVAGDIGMAAAAWGLGMVLGSAAAPGLARRWSRERLVAVGLAGMGLSMVVASQAPSVSALLLIWIVAGASNGVLNVAYETLLQERTPDHLRGRVMAASDAALDAGLLVGLLLAGSVAAVLGVRGAFVLAGMLVLGSAGLAVMCLRPGQRIFSARRPTFVPSLVESVTLDNAVLVRVAGEWRSTISGTLQPVALALGGELRLPIAEPTGSEHAEVGVQPCEWRGAYSLSREEFAAWATQLALVAGDVRASLPTPEEHRRPLRRSRSAAHVVPSPRPGGVVARRRGERALN